MRHLLVTAAVLLAAAPATASTIPQGSTSAPEFTGAPATQNPVSAQQPPRHPFMAPNQRSNIHDDAYQTDAYQLAGPLGRGMSTVSTFLSSDCASVTFDSRGRIVTICVGAARPTLYLLDPHTLDTLASLPLPPRQPGISNPFQDFGGGGYFYLDNRDRAVTPTTTRHVEVIAEAPGGFHVDRDYDLTATVPFGDSIVSVLPDWSGRLWFASKKGIVGTVDPTSGAVRSLNTGEPIGNSFAVDETGGVYIVSDAALYRFDAGPGGAPHVSWRATYANTGVVKPGQTERGSGTTPTVMAGGYVSITDNADPMEVVVYRRTDGSRVCSAPVFDRGASDTDQSIVVANRAMIVENNYGYSSPAATEEGRTTTGGLERVDIDANGHGCHAVWRSSEIAPSVVPKLSLANGLVYTYTHPGGDTSDPWYLTAIDFRSGGTVYRRLAGSGLGFNNNYAPVSIGPDGTAYVGVLGGLVALRDATPPPQPGAQGAAGSSKARRFRLRFRYARGDRCTRRSVRVVLAGPLSTVRSVVWRVRGKVVAHQRRAPFAIRTSGRVTATVTLKSGRRVKLRGRVWRCPRRRPDFDG